MRSAPSLGILGLYGAVTISSLALVGFCLLHLSNHPSVGFFGDSWAYAKYAARFRDFGFLHDFGSIRTYGYPAFIYLVSFIPGALQNISLAVGMTQYALLASGALALSAQVWPTSHKIAIAIYAGLMLNLFVLSIVLDVLTDALSVPAMVWLLVVIQAAMRARTSVAVFALILVGSLIASMSVMIRPANISILIGWAVAVPIALWHRYRFAALAMFGPAVIVGLAIAWGPQLAYNLSTWGETSVFPVCQLSSIQAFYGIAMTRFDTIGLPGGSQQFFYVNPFVTSDTIEGNPLRWYLMQPLNGVLTILLRHFMGFDISHLFTYVAGGFGNERHITRFIGWAVCLFGLFNIGQIRNAPAPELVFVVVTLAIVLAINSITAVEIRFNILPIAALGVLAALWFINSSPHRVRIAVAIVVMAGFLGVGGEIMLQTLGTSKPLAIVPKVSLPEVRCYTFASEAKGS
jgi:hypothetical protein